LKTDRKAASERRDQRPAYTRRTDNVSVPAQPIHFADL
jgi:hypothetical protein